MGVINQQGSTAMTLFPVQLDVDLLVTEGSAPTLSTLMATLKCHPDSPSIPSGEATRNLKGFLHIRFTRPGF